MKVKLEELLLKKGMSLYRLSKLTGITYENLSKLKNEETKGVKFDTLDEICEKLKCSIGDLLECEKKIEN